MRVRVVDLETTGVEPTDHVVEIAAWDFDGYHGVGACSLRVFVKPPVPIPPAASAVHHIIDKDVEGALEWGEAWPLLETRFADAFAAHNAKFEKQWLDSVLPSVKWICTYRCALRVWPEAPRREVA